MKPLGAVYTPTDTVEGEFNTFAKATGAPITLAGTPSLRLVRIRAGTKSRITGAGITLAVDENDGTGAVTGAHGYTVDLDDANIAAQAGDEYTVRINAGTIDGESAVGIEVGHFYVQADGLTTQQKADVNAEADTALTDYDAPTKAELDVLGTSALATQATVLTQRSIPTKNSAFSFPFKLVDETDLVTGETGATVTNQVSKDGAAFGAAAGTVTEIGHGWYEMAGSAADMNADRLIFRFTATGAAPTEIPITTDGGV